MLYCDADDYDHCHTYHGNEGSVLSDEEQYDLSHVEISPQTLAWLERVLS